jgi:hypothetical protein
VMLAFNENGIICWVQQASYPFYRRLVVRFLRCFFLQFFCG